MARIGDQFAGLDMKNLIGGPLTAAAEASVMLAQSTADFITKVGFDNQNKTRTVQFKFQKQEPEADGSLTSSEMAVEIPLLAIVPIPNLQIDEVNILFDMEVKQSERSEKSLDMGATVEASAKIGPFSVSIKGSVSSHESNTRSSDQSAKYHVDVRATNHGTPEGLARVLDMMAANVAPNILSSRATDESGKELTGKSKERNTKMKELRAAGMQLENVETSAHDTFQLKLKALKDKGASLRAETLNKCTKTRNENSVDDKTPENEKVTKEAAYKKATDEMNNSESYWNDFNATIRDTVERAATMEEKDPKLSALYPANESKGHPDVAGLDPQYADAVKACAEWKKSAKVVENNKVEYNQVMMTPVS